MNPLKKTAFIRAIVFLICLLIVFINIDSVISHAQESAYWTNTFRIRELYQLKKNSVDVLSLGASTSINSFNTMELYNEYGISAYNAGMEQQPMRATYLMCHEILKFQKPKVIFLETQMLFSDRNESWFRKTFDGLHWSREKFNMLSSFSDNYLQDSSLSYYFPILKYHTRYKEIRKTDFMKSAGEDYYNLFLGYRPREGIYEPEEAMTALKENDGKFEEFNTISLEYLEKIVGLCTDKEIALVLYKSPVDLARGLWSIEQHNTVQQWARQNGIMFFDFCMAKEMMACGLNFSTDQADTTHVNSFGAVKITHYLGKYLDENYDLPDRRGDPEYVHLDKELERYRREKFNENFIYATDLPSYLDLLLSSDQHNYTMLISVKDEAFITLDDKLRDKLHNLGFQSDFTAENAYRHSFIGVWNNGMVAYESLSKGNDDVKRDLLEFRGTLPDGVKYYIKSAGFNVGNTSSVVIDGTEQSKNKRGLNIVIYDNLRRRIVDSVVFDTHASAGTIYSR